MRLLALDPSSTCVGYALWSDLGGRPVVTEHGRIKPSKSDMDVTGRILSLADELTLLAGELNPEVIVVEVMLGKQHTAIGKKQRVTSLPICATAMGFMWRVCREVDATTYPVDNLVWTRGTSKATRKERARQLCAAYDRSRDQGGDASDAICLGYWWLQRQKAELVCRATKGA